MKLCDKCNAKIPVKIFKSGEPYKDSFPDFFGDLEDLFGESQDIIQQEDGYLFRKYINNKFKCHDLCNKCAEELDKLTEKWIKK